MAAARMQSWALLLSVHDYTIKYRKGSLHANDAGLSRLPLPHVRHEMPGAVEVFYAAQLDTLPVSNSEITRNTKSDPILSQILKMVSTGRFPAAKDRDGKLSPYMLRRRDLTIQHDCLMSGVRVIVPSKLHPCVLKELHSTSRCGEDKVLGTHLCMVAQHLEGHFSQQLLEVHDVLNQAEEVTAGGTG